MYNDVPKELPSTSFISSWISRLEENVYQMYLPDIFSRQPKHERHEHHERVEK
jgi:hypothetical protein